MDTLIAQNWLSLFILVSLVVGLVVPTATEGWEWVRRAMARMVEWLAHVAPRRVL